MKLYKDNPVTLYCSCSFKGKKPDMSSCGYIPKKNNKRANIIEWEHIVPAQVLGKSFSEWRDAHQKCVKKSGNKFKRRKCAGKVNKVYRRIQVDMYDLYPGIGELNGKLSNFSMAIIEGEKRVFWQCDVEIKSQKVEQKESMRGEITRIYLYMDSIYPARGIISKKNRKLFDAWNKSDPIDEWEFKRERRIKKIQGNRNEIVMRDC